MVTKNQKIRLVALACGAISLFFMVSTSFADSYVLTASVPYEVPTVSSVIDTVGITTSEASTALTGTCGIITPSAIVSFWNGGSLLGATTCQLDGTFATVVNLQKGLNSVIPKTSNIANVYGPDGQAILFTYNAPQVAQPPEQSQPTAATASSVSGTPVENTPALQVSSPQPFGILSNIGEVSIDITVQGGENPYDIIIKWGDGKTDNKTVSEPGTYTFSHVYKQKNSYTANIQVKDKSGNTSNILIPFSDVKGAIAKRVITEPQTPIINGTTITLSVLAIAVLLSVTAIVTFGLGHLHRMHMYTKKTATKKAAKKLPKKPARR